MSCGWHAGLIHKWRGSFFVCASCILPNLTPGIRGAPRTCLSQLKAAWSVWRRPLTLIKLGVRVHVERCTYTPLHILWMDGCEGCQSLFLHPICTFSKLEPDSWLTAESKTNKHWWTHTNTHTYTEYWYNCGWCFSADRCKFPMHTKCSHQKHPYGAFFSEIV